MKKTWSTSQVLTAIVVTAVVSFCAGFAFAHAPASELSAVLKDAESLSPQTCAVTRWVTNYNVPENLYRERAAVLSFVLNSVSRSAKIYFPQSVPGTGGRILRIHLPSYGLDATLWESLVGAEPFWHFRTQVIDPHTKKQVDVVTDAGHVGLKNAEALRLRTGSAGALARLDQFIARIALDPEAYYNFAGVPSTLDAWYKGFGVDTKTIVELKAHYGANLFRSGVTRHPRRLSRYAGPLGVVTQTYDSNGQAADQDPIRDPSFKVKFTAGEFIAAGANGLHKFGLYDAKGARQNEVPPDIAKDDTDIHGDGRLRPMLSCVRCHAQDDGLRKFNNDQRKLMESGAAVIVGSPDEADSLGNFYLNPKLERDFDRDREDYVAAVKTATRGMTLADVAKAFASVVDVYANLSVTPAVVQSETGYADLSALRHSKDGVILAIASGIPVQRRQFDGSYPDIMLHLGSGVKPIEQLLDPE